MDEGGTRTRVRHDRGEGLAEGSLENTDDDRVDHRGSTIEGSLWW